MVVVEEVEDEDDVRSMRLTRCRFCCDTTSPFSSGVSASPKGVRKSLNDVCRLFETRVTTSREDTLTLATRCESRSAMYRDVPSPERARPCGFLKLALVPMPSLVPRLSRSPTKIASSAGVDMLIPLIPHVSVRLAT